MHFRPENYSLFIRQKVKLSLYRPGLAVRSPGAFAASIISRYSEHEDVEVVSRKHWPPLHPTPRDIPVSRFCWSLSRPQGHCPIRRIRSMKNSSNTIRNRTRFVSAVPEPPRTLLSERSLITDLWMTCSDPIVSAGNITLCGVQHAACELRVECTCFKGSSIILTGGYFT